MRVGLFAGSFDPFTNGHLEIIRTSSKLMDEVIIGIGTNTTKKRQYDENSMKKAIEEVLNAEGLNNCKVLCYSGLTVDVAKENNVKFLIRGIRNNLDYSYEEEIAKFNYEIARIDTIYLRSTTNVSSTFIKDLVKNGKDVSNYVPKSVMVIL